MACSGVRGTGMQILVVDDDLSTVECIRTSIDWAALGICEVYTAYSKDGALNTLKAHKIDIVLCDIEMPRGSGLELLEEVRKMEYDCEFIFLTCHDSFPFAAAALEYKAASYILKPFNPERITAELIKTIDNQKTLRSMYESSRYGAYWLKNKEGIERNFWKDVLQKKITPDAMVIQTEAAQRGIALLPEQRWAVALFSLQYDTLPKAKMVPREKWAADVISFLSSDAQCRTEEARMVGWWYGERFRIYCIQPSTDESSLEILRELLKRCRENLPVIVNGYAIKDISIDQIAYGKHMLDKLDHNNVGNVGQLQLFNGTQAEEKAGKQIDLSQFGPIFASGNKARILTYLRNQLELLAPERSLTPAMLYAVQQDIIREVFFYLLNRGIKPKLPSADEDSYLIMLNASTSMYNMLKWLSFFINYAVDAESASRVQNTVTEQAKSYIDAHFFEKITQNEIAKAVFLTPGHLSKVFKKEEGISLNQYINNKRISCAKQLISHSDVDISEVAVRSGFNSSSYFITYFRKVTGKTPKEYREDLAKG